MLLSSNPVKKNKHDLIIFGASQITASRFLDTFALCLSHNSAYTGSLEKLIADRPTSSTGYLPSITELKVTSRSHAESDQGKLETSSFVLPRMPPWFSYVGSQKLYEILAGILRLVGLSLMAGELIVLQLTYG